MAKKIVTDNIQALVDRMLLNPDLFDLKQQTHTNIEEYFKTNFNCTTLPEDFLSFMKILDGVVFHGLSIFAIGDNQTPEMTYDKYSTDEETEQYCAHFQMKPKDSTFFFFGSDNRGGRYAFKKNSDSQHICYLSPQNLSIITIFSSFADFLSMHIETHIQENKK